MATVQSQLQGFDVEHKCIIHNRLRIYPLGPVCLHYLWYSLDQIINCYIQWWNMALIIGDVLWKNKNLDFKGGFINVDPQDFTNKIIWSIIQD